MDASDPIKPHKALVPRGPSTYAAVALANKMARIAWKLMTTGEKYESARLGAQTDAHVTAAA